MQTVLLLPTALVTVTVALWATARLPEYLTALLFFAGATILAVAPPGVIFSGFASAAFWLILSGFVLGAAIRKVGLADRAARWLSRHLTGSWLRMVAGVVGMTYALAFVMPSNMGRIALLMPIIMAMADRAGLRPGSAGRAGLALAVGFGTFQLSASILPANVPNLVMAGTAEATYGVHLAYLPYLLLHGPVLGILKGLLLIACIRHLFPAMPQPIADDQASSPLSPAERRLGLLLLVTLALWMTDTLHGISPAWIGLASACLCLLPRIGFLSGEDFASGVNFRTCLYIAGILGLAAVVSHTGLGALIGNGLVRLLPLDEGAPAGNFAAVAGLVGALNFAVTANGVPAIFTPLASQLAGATGFSLMGLLMIQVIGYATPLLPYQASPIAVAMGMAQVTARQGIKLCLAVALGTYLILLPLDYLWFSLLGWL
ncbi:citrate transporter [Niveispirillum sp. SYP-B3756]|uniref:SLC13 family permease n=1 Tax=Niveispirillum sp. SYP-B3756 TaxID=2662178 RepID=UPI0012919175|nr:SLC13 family permease [Niveispirillum sp. SYP-B3756]MQP66507.1 citrate transporter [Niveispirillum sp. SYP-B3756]